ncbi:hypothetical protein BH20ACT16_BH20ACT16_03510 [soil metagenome]
MELAGFHLHPEGGIRWRERPTASDVNVPDLICLDGDRPDDAQGSQLTRAEARALLRSAPLTHSQLTKHLRGVGVPSARPQ